ncbi:hypothetical protein DPX16_16459 [Anabarilius grahami]|uniref:Uncharacterized protein n=1 Tax=Anabarilius grahami TaxID=495550 RepID=A0A3N0XXL4_ANAGA|nr:hypothetical protein DPX16_16459 [Anabarilius grahami]
MLENSNGAGEHKDVNQKAEKPKCTRKKCKESAAKPKGNQKMEYLRANKGLVATVLISAVIIFTVVVAMLVTKETDGHGHSKVHNATEIP